MIIFLETIIKFHKALDTLTKKKRARTQINTIGNEKGDITTDTTEIERIVKDYYEQLCMIN